MARRTALVLPLLAAAGLPACFENAEQTQRIQQLEGENEQLKTENARLDREAEGLLVKLRAMEDRVKGLERDAALARLGIDENDDIAAVFDTSMGTFACSLWPLKSPQTVLNFVQLAEGTKTWTDARGVPQTRPLYNGTLIHRVIPNFMVQMGDPEGTGRGGPGYTFADEVDNGLTFDKPGLLAMANRGPDTNGSQFFVTDRATPHHLDRKHTIFGECENLDVVQAIAETERDGRDRPVQPVVLERVRIFRARN